MKIATAAAILVRTADRFCAPMSDHSQSKGQSLLPIDPKELMPAAIGFVIGLLIIAAFALLAQGIDLTLFVDKSAIPHQ